MDDFAVVGFRDSLSDAHRSHDANVAFIRRWEDSGVRLNPGKMQLRISEIPRIGHVATGEGLRVDPEKCEQSPICRDLPTCLQSNVCWA